MTGQTTATNEEHAAAADGAAVRPFNNLIKKYVASPSAHVYTSAIGWQSGTCARQAPPPSNAPFPARRPHEG